MSGTGGIGNGYPVSFGIDIYPMESKGEVI